MSIFKKTRADLATSLYFYTPCLSLVDIGFALRAYDEWGHSPYFFEILATSKRDFENYNVVHEIIREFFNDCNRIAARESEKAQGKKEISEKNTAQQVKAYIEKEKNFDRIREAGESEENIQKIRQVQKVFQGRFITC